jgi:hypothetical protein
MSGSHVSLHPTLIYVIVIITLSPKVLLFLSLKSDRFPSGTGKIPLPCHAACSMVSVCCGATVVTHYVNKNQYNIVAMVRKNAAAEASLTSQSVTTTSTGQNDRDVQNHNNASRKSKKRRQQDTIRGCLVVLLVLIIVLLSLVVIMTHSTNPRVSKYASSKLLRRNNNNKDRTLVDSSSDRKDRHDYDNDQKRNSGGQEVEFLPPNSVYKVSMESIAGELIDLSKYRGLVSLIVNVACL